VVQFIFFLATPAGAADLHVQILAAIANAMQSSRHRQELAHAPDAQTLYDVLGALLETPSRTTDTPKLVSTNG